MKLASMIPSGQARKGKGVKTNEIEIPHLLCNDIADNEDGETGGDYQGTIDEEDEEDEEEASLHGNVSQRLREALPYALATMTKTKVKGLKYL